MDKCPHCNKLVRQYGAYSDSKTTKRYYRCKNCQVDLVEVLDISEYPFMRMVRVDTVPLEKKNSQKTLMEF